MNLLEFLLNVSISENQVVSQFQRRASAKQFVKGARRATPTRKKKNLGVHAGSRWPLPRRSIINNIQQGVIAGTSPRPVGPSAAAGDPGDCLDPRGGSACAGAASPRGIGRGGVAGAPRGGPAGAGGGERDDRRAVGLRVQFCWAKKKLLQSLFILI